MKVIDIARVCHEINRAYCESLGDDSQVPWEQAEEWQQKSAIAGVEMHLANPDATPEQSHESWLAEKLADGWQYGDVKDAENKLHPCCVPYAELPQSQRSKDYIFRSIVHQLKDAEKEPAPLASARKKKASIPSGSVGVKYVGGKSTYIDRLYNTGLSWESGQTRYLPGGLAQNFLKHRDVFEQADVPVQEDDTEEVLEDADLAAAQKKKDLQIIETIHLEIQSMDKDALANFAERNYQQKIDKRRNVDELRAQVTQMVDQFGVL